MGDPLEVRWGKQLRESGLAWTVWVRQYTDKEKYPSDVVYSWIKKNV